MADISKRPNQIRGHVWYTLAEVAAIFNVEPRTVMNWLNRSNKFPNAVKPTSNRWKIPGHDILNLLKGDFGEEINFGNAVEMQDRFTRMESTITELTSVVERQRGVIAARETTIHELETRIRELRHDTIKLHDEIEVQGRIIKGR